MYEKELEEIQRGWDLHGRTLIRIGFDEALKLTTDNNDLDVALQEMDNAIKSISKELTYEVQKDLFARWRRLNEMLQGKNNEY